uniref:Uncharacterized protein n=1 Tax=Vitis vinifera TaxID=29760 RepID=A5AE69_VITVI|nr:hypothetical protein VITISV_015806 [Vitis vinifera]
MARTKGAKSSFPYGRKGIVREAFVQGSTSEPPLQVAAPPPAEPASLSHLARRYQTRSGGRPPQKKTRVVDPDPSLEPSLALSLEPLAEPQPSQPPLVESQIPSGIAPEVLIRRPMVPQPPIEGNLDCRARPFHSELCFDTATFRFQPELVDSFRLLHRYRMEHLLTPKDFFYPRVAMDFYQSMTTNQVRDPTLIHFTIDGRHGILGARHIAEALHIPYEPARLEDYRLFDHQSNPRLRRVLWNPWQKMFGQGVQTPSEGGGKWVFFIRTTYPDRICYRPECDRHECRVLLLEGVQIGERAAIPPGCITSEILLRHHSTRMSHIRNLHR